MTNEQLDRIVLCAMADKIQRLELDLMVKESVNEQLKKQNEELQKQLNEKKEN